MRSRSRRPLCGTAHSVLLSLALLGAAGMASAQGTAHPAKGILKTKNVTLVHAPEQAAALRAGGTGMRAYVDETGALREQTPEEAAQAGLKSAQAMAKATKSTEVASPFGGFIAELDETFMLSNVVTRDASGRLRMICVPASGVAAALRGSGKEHGHAH